MALLVQVFTNQKLEVAWPVGPRICCWRVCQAALGRSGCPAGNRKSRGNSFRAFARGRFPFVHVVEPVGMDRAGAAALQLSALCISTIDW